MCNYLVSVATDSANVIRACDLPKLTRKISPKAKQVILRIVGFYLIFIFGKTKLPYYHEITLTIINPVTTFVHKLPNGANY